MATVRAHFSDYIRGFTGGPDVFVGGATVTLNVPGSVNPITNIGTPISQLIYSSLSGGGTFTNPLTTLSNGIDSTGKIEFWLPGEQTIDFTISAPNYTTQTFEGIAVRFDGGS